MLRVAIVEKGGTEREQFFDVAEVSIGRVQGNSIVLPKPNVSKRHATVTLENGTVTIVDQKSTNGTYINGRRISGPRVLSPEDRVYIGDFTLRFSEVAATADIEPTPVPPLPVAGAAGPENRAATISMSAFSPEVQPPPMPPIPEEARAEVEVPLDFDVEVAPADLQPEVVEPPPPPPPPPEVATRVPPTEMNAKVPVSESVEIDVSSRVAAVTDVSANAPHRTAAHASLEGSHGARGQMSGLARRVSGPGVDRGAAGHWAEALQVVAEEAATTVFGGVEATSGEFTDEAGQRMSDGGMRLVDQLRRENRLPADVDPYLLTQDMLYEFTGLGLFEDLLADEQVRTILVEGLDRVWVSRGGRPEPVVKAFANEATQARVLGRLLDLAGTPREALERPMVTGRMPDGTTLRILNPPLAADGRLIVLERPHATTLSLEDLVRVGVIEEALAQRVKDTLHAHRGIAVCGGSQERRAAMVSALLRALPAGERLLVLDGPQNLSPRREGAILMDRLSVLQMGPMAASMLVALHPDLVAVGDVDPEVLALLARLATGARPGLVLSDRKSVG